MYAIETNNFNSTEFDKMMFLQSYSVMGFYRDHLLIFAVLAALEPSYPVATSIIIVGTFAAHAMI